MSSTRLHPGELSRNALNLTTSSSDLEPALGDGDLVLLMKLPSAKRRVADRASSRLLVRIFRVEFPT